MIVVNATALVSGGALTILKQFLHNASLDTNAYMVFVSNNLNLPEYKNIQYVESLPKGWLQRIYWDSYGLKKYIHKNDVKVRLIISLQNTSINLDVPQIIYLHQPIPFSEVKFNLFQISDIKLFLYKYFYVFFVFLFVKQSTKFVVQTKWMKIALTKKAINTENIFVIRPNILFPKNATKYTNKNSGNILLYPATPLSYKNHLVVLQALRLLKEESIDFIFEVTFSEHAHYSFDKLVNEFGLINNIRYLGVIEYNELILKYQHCKAVLFPSYLETFGLPLAEAAFLGKQVLSADLPYARDVLEGYTGVTFIKHDDAKAWAAKINEILHSDVKYFESYTLDNSATWKDFFKLINKE